MFVKTRNFPCMLILSKNNITIIQEFDVVQLDYTLYSNQSIYLIYL